MASKRTQLNGVAALSITMVGLAMGVTSAADELPVPELSMKPLSCNDFAAALFDKAYNSFNKFIKGEDLLQKVRPFNSASPFLKFEGALSGFMKWENNIAGFYQVSTGNVDIFLKDALTDTYLPAVQYCVSDGTGVTRGFFDKATSYNGETTLAGAQVSFLKVDNKAAFLKIELEAVTIEADISVGEDGKPTTRITEIDNSTRY
jgi:hypothetical protein